MFFKKNFDNSKYDKREIISTKSTDDIKNESEEGFSSWYGFNFNSQEQYPSNCNFGSLETMMINCENQIMWYCVWRPIFQYSLNQTPLNHLALGKDKVDMFYYEDHTFSKFYAFFLLLSIVNYYIKVFHINTLNILSDALIFMNKHKYCLKFIDLNPL